MEAFSFPSPLNTIPISPTSVSSGRSALLCSGRPSFRSLPGINRKCQDAANMSLQRFHPPRTAVVTRNASGSNLQETEVTNPEISPNQDDIVFVAGSTGRVGSRTVRELLKLGFQVRAGVRNAQRAETLVQSVQQMKLNETSASTPEIQPEKRLQIIECNLENPGDIGPAIGNASVVICCIGASEKEIFDVTGPYRIDYQATKNLIVAATSAKVNHFILLTSLGTEQIGFPAALLNLFWGVLTWKRKAEEDLIASGLPYTIVRPGGMERPTDTFKETHNLVLANANTYFGGLVSNLQVAELLAVVAKNRGLSYCKVVEVIAETTAPLTPMEELLAKIPSQRVDTSVAKESPPTPEPDPTPVNTSTEPEQLNPQKQRPLSPYVVYEDLKPPTSPSPTAPKPKLLDTSSGNSSTAAEIADTNEHLSQDKLRTLSPFTVYEDLMPPTTPTPPAPKSELLDSNSGGLPLKSQKIIYNDNNKAFSHIKYEDLKPPSSPSPTPVSQPSVPSSGDKISSATESATEKDTLEEDKQRPLSPFTMYEDLKPPSSPSPSTPKY